MRQSNFQKKSTIGSKQKKIAPGGASNCKDWEFARGMGNCLARKEV